MSKLEKIKDRYEKGFITPEQLQKYVDLQVITPEQFAEITVVPEVVVVEAPLDEPTN